VVPTGTILSNRYLILRELGSGGMGSVYEATDLRTGGTVAVKTLHPHLARDAQFISRLRREAQIAAAIRTRRAVKVIDLDEHEGLHYLVMEYVTGENLSDRLERVGRLPLDEALAIALDVARALEGAHAVGVVHRDLKPQNVRLTEDGEVKVLDFGIARIADQPGITTTNVFTGTPEYCAPERMESHGDVRSDIYSIGVMLYEMIAGRRPFTGPTAFSILRQHEIAPVPPLPFPVPPEVQAVIDRCLAKKPEERYETPTKLVEALRAAREAVLRAARAAGSPDLPPTVSLPRAEARPEARAETSVPAVAGAGELAVGVSGAAARPSATPTAPPSTGGGLSRQALLIAGGMVLVLVVVAVAALLLIRSSLAGDGRADGGGAPAMETVAAAVSPPSGPAATVSPAPAALLTAGQRVRLDTVSRALILVDASLCPGAGGRVQLTSELEVRTVEYDGRLVYVTYAIAVPEVPGLQCTIEYRPDFNTANVVLVTKKPSGVPIETRTAGGAGLAVTGAPQIYGKKIDGVWAFEGVDLAGVELQLVQRNADGSELHRVTLLPISRQP
jgi:serine/threonine-protein kinase